MGSMAVCPKVDSILKNKDIIAHFQPIVSIHKAKIVGFEALCRGFCPKCNKLMMPNVIFNENTPKKTLCELDNLCKKTALKHFEEVSALDEEQLLFLNFDVSYISNPDSFMGVFDGLKIPPNRVVVEIIESKVDNNEMLETFARICREQGFLIALDDVGAGYSNFDRISLLHPDIIKIDRSIIDNIHEDHFKQEVLKSLVSLSRRIGAVVLTEGIEKEEEAIQCLNLGADFLQGYYFLKPQDIKEDMTFLVKDKIAGVANNFRMLKLDHIRSLKKIHEGVNSFISDLKDQLNSKPESEFQNVISARINDTQFIDAIYMLNDEGLQATDTIVNCIGPACSLLPKSGKKGVSHEYKEGFYLLMNGLFDRYTTDAYMSTNTGNICKTASMIFHHKDGKSWIICFEIREKQDNVVISA